MPSEQERRNEDYRLAILAASAVAASTVRSYFQFLPVNVDDATWRRFIDLVYDAVMKGRLEVFNLTTAFYMDNRPTADDPPEFIERRYPPRRLERALAPPRARITGIDELLAEEARIAAEQAEAITAEHVMASGRQSVEDATTADKLALGWVRVPSGAETCAFCTMLASRGPVEKETRKGQTVIRGLYRTEQTALFGQGGEPYHPNCDCIAVPVYDRNNWPGREKYLEAQDLWDDVKEAGFTGREALNEIRRRIYAQQKQRVP